MEEALLHTAAESDHDVLARVAYHWIGAIDQDGTEPTEEELRRRQGAFLRRPRRACTTWKSSPPPTNTNTSSPS
jgi:hypothetical protein